MTKKRVYIDWSYFIGAFAIILFALAVFALAVYGITLGAMSLYHKGSVLFLPITVILSILGTTLGLAEVSVVKELL